MSEGDWPDDDHVDNHYQVDHSIKQPYGDLTLLGQGRYRGVWLTPENDVYNTVYGYHSRYEVARSDATSDELGMRQFRSFFVCASSFSLNAQVAFIFT